VQQDRYSYLMPRLTFLGGARTVTGSKYLLEYRDRRILIDCGLFQGLKTLRARNWEPLPVPPDSIDAVVLTHAHLDHTGYLPRLVGGGFRGRAFCTPGTMDLCRIVLPDAARLQEEDARDANRHGYTRHAPALPLFTTHDAVRAIERLQPVGFDRAMPAAPGVTIRFTHTGHLLGSAAVTVSLEDGPTLVFGGDLGRYDRPVLRDPDPVTEADILLVESTYGDRPHEADDDGARLAAIVRETIGRGGRIIIPAFAIGRVEEVLYWLKRLEEAQEIPRVSVFLDSPMAVEALRFYAARADELDDDMRGAGKPLANFATSRFQCVTSPQHSAELVASKTPAIVVSSSGMATGGRVLHHLKRVLPDKRSTVLFVGYQAPGTRGRALLDGAAEVKMHGQFVPVAATIAKIDSMSAHADAGEMVRWLRNFRRPPGLTCLVHGDGGALEGMRAAIAEAFGDTWRTCIPEHMEALEFAGTGIDQSWSLA
jgi:metallo-beta-lactamase family protein